MPEYVRVRDRHTGHEYDVVAGAVNPEDHEVLESYPPSRGWPRPAKFRTDKAGVPQAGPSLSWTRERLDEHASLQGIDVSGAAPKADVLAAIDAASQTPPTGEDDPATDPGATTTE